MKKVSSVCCKRLQHVKEASICDKSARYLCFQTLSNAARDTTVMYASLAKTRCKKHKQQKLVKKAALFFLAAEWLLVSFSCLAQTLPESYGERGVLELTDPQMDAVTAGTVYLSALAIAGGLDKYVEAVTQTEVHVRQRGIVEIGYAKASAAACCGSDTYAAVSFLAAADGDVVFSTRKIIEADIGGVSFAKGWAFVVSVKLPAPLLNRR